MKNELDPLFDLVRGLPDAEGIENQYKKVLLHPSFFPVGTGLLDLDDQSISDKEVMVLGQDWGCKHWVDQDEHDPAWKKQSTWRNIFYLLEASEIEPNNCFYTNALMGVRTGMVGTGPSPAWKNPGFVKACTGIFRETLRIQKPKLILALGAMVARFLASADKGHQLEAWSKNFSFKNIDEAGKAFFKNVHFVDEIRPNVVLVVHPSFRNSNVARRRYGEIEGHEAEVAMVREALKTYSILEVVQEPASEAMVREDLKTYSITIPYNKEKVFIEWMKKLDFVKRIEQQSSLDIPEEHKEIVRQRIKNTSKEDLLDWDEVKDTFRL